jgi:hypothetical protein
MESELFELLGDLTWERNQWDLSVEAALNAYRGDDPNQEAPVDPAVREEEPELLSWGGIRYAEDPLLAPDWRPRYPDGYLFADDLLTEGLDLLSSGDALAARAKLECSVAVLDRMRRYREVVSTTGMIRRMRGGVYLLRLACVPQARRLLAPLVKVKHASDPPSAPSV